MNPSAPTIASALSLSVRSVDNTLQLLSAGSTIPFISRYRKEMTGGLDEVQIGAIAEMGARLAELEKRKSTIIATITEQGKMTPELRHAIDSCNDANTLEDIYLPYKPRRRTRAQAAREKGLEPLAEFIMRQRDGNPRDEASRYVKGDVADADEALQGALDIIAEEVSETARARDIVRSSFRLDAVITSKAVKAKVATEEAANYAGYFDFSCPLRRCASHQLLAMRRGESEGCLRVSVAPASDDEPVGRLERLFVRGRSAASSLVAEAVGDAYKRLLRPSIESEFAAAAKEKADEEAINVFGENLRQLLLSAPLGQKRVMGIDPGFRTGCKVVCLDAQGTLLHHEAIFPHPPRVDARAADRVRAMASRFAIEAIAIGNGTAGRETERFVRSLGLDGNIGIYSVSEDGASVYSASAVAREEFPDEDVTVRGAVSIGRRLMDPLAELVKIDPKSIGVGQYQHDVNQSRLRQRLDRVVESCVNAVGVNLNTASRHLLTYVSGLGPVLAKNIVDYRTANGPFASRAQLKKVPRLGPVAFQQCAGFLRIPEARNPLDNSAVHPESYPIVEKMAKATGCTVRELIADSSLRRSIHPEQYVTDTVGLPTLTDILAELEKPGRDPREHLEQFAFDERVSTIESLSPGMVLPGIVTNITNFGAFVDIGVHQDGLVHISQLADRFVSDPMQVVRLHQHVTVRVLDVDLRRRRISLTLRF